MPFTEQSNIRVIYGAGVLFRIQVKATLFQLLVDASVSFAPFQNGLFILKSAFKFLIGRERSLIKLVHLFMSSLDIFNVRTMETSRYLSKVFSSLLSSLFSLFSFLLFSLLLLSLLSYALLNQREERSRQVKDQKQERISRSPHPPGQ
uniref:Uncharacterized protein n=1 Tax=Micrurus lemniscatus lemniscatus TaxID=129467 RepID=A0A2D4IJ62_MICLE